MASLAVDSRRMICTSATFNTDDAWDVEQGEALLRKAAEVYPEIR
jgi:hypothetical protein